MTRNELITRVSQRTGQSSATVREILDLALAECADEVLAGGRFTLPGLGSFSRKWVAPRKTRHPRTGRLLHLDPRFAVQFRPSLSLKSRLDTLLPQFDDEEHRKARRAAHTIAEDLRIYYPALISDGKKGVFSEELLSVLQEARDRYVARVSANVIGQRDYLGEELSALFGRKYQQLPR